MHFRLIYISTARPAVDESELQSILAAAREKNAQLGLTGILLYDGKRFMQYLEGDEATINALYRKISDDNRHFAVVTLREGFGSERQFPNWQMASMWGLGAAEFDENVERIDELISKVDPLTAAELSGFVARSAA